MEDSDSDYYSDSSGESPPKSAEKKKDNPARTALADKALFPEDVKPGYKCEIEVLRVHESEVEFRKLSHKKESELKSSTTKSAPISDADEYA